MNLDRRLLKLLAAVRRPLLLTIGLGFAAGALTVGQAWYLSQTVSRVFLQGEVLSQVKPLLVILLGIILLRAAAAGGGELAANALARGVKIRLRQRLLAHIIALGPSYTSAERSGELANTAMDGIEALDAYFRQYLPQLVLAVLVPLTFLVFVFPRDLLSGLVLLVTAPLIPIFMSLIGSLAEEKTRRQWRVLSRMSAYFLDVLQGLTTLKILGRSREQVQVIEQISAAFRQRTMAVLRVAFLSALVLELSATISTAVIAVEIGLRLLYGRLPFSEAFFVLLLAPEFYQPLRLLGTRFHAGIAGIAAAQRIFLILETPAQPGPPPNLELAPAVRPTPASHTILPIRFDDVHYRYAPGRPALRGVSFSVEPGCKVALVGPSGGGKSTLASLLLRFITPDAGRITAGERPLSAIPPATWRQHIAWVPQSAYLFHDSIAANIRLARPNATPDEVRAAARRAHADEFIQALPAGYDTLIGERGARLSAGQARRIALARAFLKDSPILLLDEATSHLDPDLEARLQAALDRFLSGRTALIIAHRLSTVTQVDQILLLDGGRIRDQGTHTGLLASSVLYRRLVGAYGGAA